MRIFNMIDVNTQLRLKNDGIFFAVVSALSSIELKYSVTSKRSGAVFSSKNVLDIYTL